MKNLIYFFILSMASFTVQAEPITIKLDLPGMFCAVCPITVSKALNNVQGVIEVNASLESKSAIVTYDDDETDVGSLIAATTNAGFPSTLME